MAVTGAGRLRLSKSAFDVAVFTNRIDPVLAFWRDVAGLKLAETQQIREGYTQYRHGVAGAFVKLGHMEAPLPANSRTGLRELVIARKDCTAPNPLVDPDGNLVTLVPPGTFGVSGVGLWMHVRDIAASERFFAEIVGLPVEPIDGGLSVAIGESRLLLRKDASVTAGPPLQGPGWRFLTLPVFDARGVYAEMLARGARDGMAPKRMGDMARYAFIRDSDGNWIELSQRASLTGPIGDDN